ncbi:MAG TPA: TfoX/Sxy family protein [Gaiellaceae bacterium]|jgi:TfoX/Sxy family transcriptional regulator of competence genes
MDAQERFEEIVDDVLARHGDVERTQMMGMPSLKRNGKLVAGLWKETMAFKLPDQAQREQALALGGATLFDPGERGRPFKEWVAVPAEHADRWPELAEQALA